MLTCFSEVNLGKLSLSLFKISITKFSILFLENPNLLIITFLYSDIC